MSFGARMTMFCTAFFFSTFSCVAATVCVLVVESGLASDSASLEASSAWEAGFMDAFFDAGHIVTNGTISRSADHRGGGGAKLPALDFGVQEAGAGGAEYLLLAVLDYGRPEGSPVTPRPSPIGVVYRMLELGTEEVIAEGREVNGTKMVSLDEEAREAGNVARIIMKRLKER